jgi:preprotein translocase subunit SecG
MTVLYYIILILHLIACFFLIAVVLLQQGKGQDLASAFGGGGTQAAFGPRGSATVLSRATTALAAIFMITSLSLSVLKERQASIIEQVAPGAPAATPTTPTDVLGVALPSPTPAAAGSPAASPAASAAPAAASPAASAPSPSASPTK